MSNFSSGYAIAKLQARMDAEAMLQVREDAPKCKPGNKPCGERCIPQAQKCKSEGGGNGKKIAAGVGAAAAIGIGAALLSRRKSGEEGSQKALSGSSSRQLALPAAGGTGRKALKGSDDKKALKGGSGSKTLPSGGQTPSLPPSRTPAFRTVETKRPAYA